MSRARFVREYKLVLVGGGGVGKSAITIQFTQGEVVNDYDPTFDDSYRKQCVIDNEVAFVDVLDTAGQEEYRAVRERDVRLGEGFLLVYSITSRSSFEEIRQFHQEILRVKDADDCPVVLVGNKCDLEFERQVGMHEGRDLAASFRCQAIETSANPKQTINVHEAFFLLVRAIRRYNKGRILHLIMNPSNSLATDILPLLQEQQQYTQPKNGLGPAPRGIPGDPNLAPDSHNSGCCHGCVVL